MECYIGTSGYVYWHWRDRFYPKELSSYKWFDYYAKYFNTVEINMSFYKWPSENIIKAWKNKVKKLEKEGKIFLYTLKANKQITHIRKLIGIKKILKNFYKLAENIEPYLGCILFQLPPSLKFDEKRIENFVNLLDENYINVIEFRHKSWWNNGVYKILKNKAVFCIVSAPNLPEDFIKTHENIYIRFHGKQGWYRSNYSDNELKDWAKKIKNSKAKKVFVYFNNDFNAYAVFNALKLKEFLKC
ncbi:MAG: DUF72 domain-containing protein [Candidatus Pacearchaeota archaeon]